MSSTTLTTSRDPKGLKFVANVEAVYNKANLDDERAQQLNESSEFIDALRKLIQRWSTTNQFANEVVASSYSYLSGYATPKPIADQVKILKEFFPDLGTVDESIATRDLPTDDVEGSFAISRWERIAPTYGEAVQKVLDLIKQTRDGKFYNYCEGQLGPQHLRQHARTAEKFHQLGQQQEGHDILVVPCQFGILHRGRSVRRAREVMPANEFGLDAFSVGIMLLTHPERLRHLNDLWIDCAGDEFSPVADGRFSKASCFLFSDGQVEFVSRDVDLARDYCGSASGFLAQ